MPEELDFDALADSIFGSSSSDEGQGADDESAEAEQSDPTNEDVEEPKYSLDELESLIAERLQNVQAEQAKAARLQDIEKLLAEGEDEEVGRWIKAQAQEAKARDAYSAAALEPYAESLLNTLLPDDYVAELSREDRATLYKMAEDSRTDAEYFGKVSEFKAKQTWRSLDEDTFNKRVEEAVQAKLNEQQSNKFRSLSASQAPSARPGNPSIGASSEDLWSAAFEEMGLKS